MRTTIIEVLDLEKTYHMGDVGVQALKGVSFSVKRGEFVGIMGYSGSGKSTLLHMVGLLDAPSAGSILIDGLDVLSLSEQEKTMFRLNRFGFVFQDYALVQELTALENVILPSVAMGIPLERCMESGSEVLSDVGLGERTEHLPSMLSGGEQQRVAVARAIVNKPDILFADEPCANLDTVNSKHVLELFREINREKEQTVMMVSHEEWHMEYFDRLIRLKDGIIEEDVML
jgi:putative ABC transport system ATP-binding protein